VVVSSAFTAGYDVAYKYLLGAELTDTTTVLILTGLSGVLTIPMWIVGSVLVAHSPFDSLYETFAWPSSGEGVALLFLSGSLAVLFNVCMPLLLVWTSPLETSVAEMLAVPLSGVWDVAFHGTAYSSACIVGSVLVLVGYGVLETAPPREDTSHGVPA
jgi:solute carrier family 35, member F5